MIYQNPEPIEEVNPELVRKLRHKQALEKIIHWQLIVGVLLSLTLMLAGLILGLVLQSPLPESVPAMNEVIPLALALHPSGFLALGLLVLIATPIVRVFASIFTFVIEGDWKYALVTLVVLLIVLISIAIGAG